MTNRRNFLYSSSAIASAAFLNTSHTFAQAKYKAAIIGRTGGGNYGHGFDVIFNNLDNVSIAAVADPDDAGREQAAKRSGAARQYADFHEMLEKEKPYLVSIGPRHPDCHKEMALAAIESGAHIYLEKPITEAPDESDEIIKAAEKNNIKIAVGHQRRYMKLFHQMKGIIENNRIGTVLEMRVYGKQDARSGGEDLIVLGTHDFDIMRFYFGDPLWCNATVWKNGKDITIDDAHIGKEPLLVAGDTISATFAFPNNLFCYWSSVKTNDHWNTNFTDREKWRFDINGSKAILAYQVTFGTAIWDSPFPAHTDGSVQWKALPEPKNWDIPEHNLHPIKNLIYAIEHDEQPLCSMYDGRWAVEMVSSVYQSHFKRGRVEFPLKQRQHPLRKA